MATPGTAQTTSGINPAVDSGTQSRQDDSGTNTGGFASAVQAVNVPPPVTMRAISPQRPIAPDHHAPGTSSPPHSMSIAVSPGRIRSASPGLSSPASSLIFERNVQETTVPDDLTGKLPSHIQTEDQIPAVLEASSIAITDEQLRPEEVEILTHSVHQPAIVTVASSGSGLDSGAVSPVHQQHHHHHQHHDQSGLSSPGIAIAPEAPTADDRGESSYGSIDPTDVRRLSFISFADVVQGEHAEHNSVKDGVLHMTLSESTANRSPSPTGRLPASPGFAPSPPTSGAPSVHQGFDSVGMTKVHNGPGSPVSLGQQSPSLLPSGANPGGDLMVEKMSEALRKTGSGDLLSGAGAHPVGGSGVSGG